MKKNILNIKVRDGSVYHFHSFPDINFLALKNRLRNIDMDPKQTFFELDAVEAAFYIRMEDIHSFTFKDEE